MTIALLSVWWLGARRYKLSLEVLRHSMIFLGLLAYYTILSISVAYSDNVSYALKTLETKISLIILPILLCGIRWDERLRNNALKLYVITVVLTSLFSIVSTIIYYKIDFTDWSYFSWVLPMTTELSANYYSLYVVFALLILVFGFNDFDFKINSILAAVGVTYLVLFLAMLSSRASFIGFFLILTIYFLRMILSRDPKLKRSGIIAILSISLLATTLGLSVPYLRDRISQFTMGIQNDPRIPIFKSSMSLISNHPVLGVGVGDVQDELREVYRKNNYHEALQNNYNPHNDWFQTLVATGIIGFLSFCFVHVQVIKDSLRLRNIFMVSFFILYVSASAGESILERNKGVVLYSFFLTLIFLLRLFHSDPPKQGPLKTSQSDNFGLRSPNT